MTVLRLTEAQAAAIRPMLMDERRMPLASFRFVEWKEQRDGEVNVEMVVGHVKRSRIEAIRTAALGRKVARQRVKSESADQAAA